MGLLNTSLQLAHTKRLSFMIHARLFSPTVIKDEKDLFGVLKNFEN